MLFTKAKKSVAVSSASQSILEMAEKYIQQEKQRAKEISNEFEGYEGILVWGAGDNFFRSAENGGPLADLRNMIVIDRRPQEIEIGSRRYRTIDPAEGMGVIRGPSSSQSQKAGRQSRIG